MNVAESLLTLQGYRLTFNKSIVDTCEIVKNVHFNAADEIIHYGNGVHSERDIVIHLRIKQKIADGISSISAAELLAVVINEVISKGDLFHRGIDLISTDIQSVNISHSIAVDLNSRGLLCIVIHNEKHQKIRLVSVILRFASLVLIKTKHQEGFDVILQNVFLVLIDDLLGFGTGGSISSLLRLPRLKQQQSGSNEKKQSDNNSNMPYIMTLTFNLSHNTPSFSMEIRQVRFPASCSWLQQLQQP